MCRHLSRPRKCLQHRQVLDVVFKIPACVWIFNPISGKQLPRWILTESRDNERAGAPPPASVGAFQPPATMTNNRVHGNKSKADIKRRVTQWISDHPAPSTLVSIHTEAGLMLDPESFSCYSEHPQLNVSKS